jgi:hypothetical protein
MTARHRRSTEPLSPHLLLSLAHGQTLLPWCLMRESLGRSTESTPTAPTAGRIIRPQARLRSRSLLPM